MSLWEYLHMQAAHTCPEIQDSCSVRTTSWVHTLHRCIALSVTACLATLKERDMPLKESLEIYGRIMQQQRWWQTYKSQGGKTLLGQSLQTLSAGFLSNYTTDSLYKEWVTEIITLCTTYCNSWCKSKCALEFYINQTLLLQLPKNRLLRHWYTSKDLI